MDKISLLYKFTLTAFLIAATSTALALTLLSDQFSLIAKLILVLTNLVFALLVLYLAAKTRETLLYFNAIATQIASGELDREVDRKLTSEFAQTAKSLDNMRTALRDRINSLEERKDRAEAVVFNVGEGVFAVTLKGELIIFNQVAEKIVGLKKDLVLGQKYEQVLQFFNSKTKESYGAFINKVLLEGKSVEIDTF